MGKRKTLEDLYRHGTYVTVTDDKGNSVKVWIEKLGDFEHEKATRMADAAKARLAATFRDTDSDLYVATREQVIALGDDPAPLIDFLAEDDVAKRVQALRDEVQMGEDSEWFKDGYLNGLLDAWQGVDGEPGLDEVLARGESGDETVDPAELDRAKHVLAEMERCQLEVSDRIKRELNIARRKFDDLDIESLRDQALSVFIDDLTRAEWVRVFYLARVFYGTRDADDHDHRHYSNFERVERAPLPIKEQLLKAYSALVVDDITGKDLPRPRPSSAPSEQPDTPEGSSSSGPADAAA
jgi:hypothetical protein